MLDLLLLSLLLWILAHTQARPTSWRWLCAGLTLGLLTLSRENALLILPALLLWLALRFRDSTSAARRLAWAAVPCAGATLILLPVGLRNLRVGAEFALTTAQAGPNFFIGNNPRATGQYFPLIPGRGDARLERTDATRLAERAAGHPLTPREVSRFWFDQAFAFIRECPTDELRLTARKFLLMINAGEIADTEDIYYYAQDCGLLRALLWGGHFGVLLPMAATIPARSSTSGARSKSGPIFPKRSMNWLARWPNPASGALR